jgi:hypothetical protein
MPTDNIKQLNEIIMTCRECYEFCKDYLRLEGKIPYKNCHQYEKSTRAAELQKQRIRSRVIKKALNSLPYMSEEGRRKTLDVLFPKVPSK